LAYYMNGSYIELMWRVEFYFWSLQLNEEANNQTGTIMHYTAHNLASEVPALYWGEGRETPIKFIEPINNDTAMIFVPFGGFPSKVEFGTLKNVAIYIREPSSFLVFDFIPSWTTVIDPNSTQPVVPVYVNYVLVYDEYFEFSEPLVCNHACDYEGYCNMINNQCIFTKYFYEGESAEASTTGSDTGESSGEAATGDYTSYYTGETGFSTGEATGSEGSSASTSGYNPSNDTPAAASSFSIGSILLIISFTIFLFGCLCACSAYWCVYKKRQQKVVPQVQEQKEKSFSPVIDIPTNYPQAPIQPYPFYSYYPVQYYPMQQMNGFPQYHYPPTPL